MNPENKHRGKVLRQERALERLEVLMSNKKHLPKRFQDENGNITLKGVEFKNARKKYEEELKIQMKTLKERINRRYD